MQRAYDHRTTQMAISLLLLSNFALSIIQSELTSGMDDSLIEQVC